MIEPTDIITDVNTYTMSELCWVVFSLYMKKTDTLFSCNSNSNLFKIIRYVTFFKVWDFLFSVSRG